jgi:hypothetical protein
VKLELLINSRIQPTDLRREIGGHRRLQFRLDVCNRSSENHQAFNFYLQLTFDDNHDVKYQRPVRRRLLFELVGPRLQTVLRQRGTLDFRIGVALERTDTGA